MTNFALVGGMLPLAVGTGPGSEERRAVAVVVIGGQMLSLFLTLVVTPVAYSLMDDGTPWSGECFIENCRSASIRYLQPNPLGRSISSKVPEIAGIRSGFAALAIFTHTDWSPFAGGVLPGMKPRLLLRSIHKQPIHRLCRALRLPNVCLPNTMVFRKALVLARSHLYSVALIYDLSKNQNAGANVMPFPGTRSVRFRLKITDASNNVQVVQGVAVDYGTFAADKETEGIRLYQGDAVVTAKWINIGTLTVVSKDESVTPPRIHVEVVMKSGEKVSAALYRKGRMRLLGKTTLGDYAIDLDKVRSIVPSH